MEDNEIAGIAMGPWSVVEHAALPSITACWCPPGGFLDGSGQRARPGNQRYADVHGGDNAADCILEGATRCVRTSETWKRSQEQQVTVYLDTARGTLVYVLGSAASRVWLACDGVRSAVEIEGALGDRDSVNRCLEGLVRKGLLACQKTPAYSC